MGADTQENIIGLREAKGKVKILETRSCGFTLREKGNATSFLIKKNKKRRKSICWFYGFALLGVAAKLRFPSHTNKGREGVLVCVVWL